MPFPVNFLPQHTERLVLRRFTRSDLDRFLAYRHDPQVARFQSWSMLSEDEATAFINEMNTAAIGMPGEWFQIAIAQQQSNLLVGDIGMQVYQQDPTVVEIGFTLDRKEQGKGYAQEAVQALINSLFELSNITRVIGITDIRNQPSVTLMTRVGMMLVKSEEVEFKNELCVEQTFELKEKDCLLCRNANIVQYWQTYLQTLPINSPVRSQNYEAQQWGDNPDLATELGLLILAGTKTATCSAVWQWEAQKVSPPAIGPKTIVLNGNNEPLCIVETTEVTVRPYCEVDAQFASDEGEGDRSLEYWREAHWRYFSRVLPKIGKEPTIDMLLVCERFKVVYKP